MTPQEIEKYTKAVLKFRREPDYWIEKVLGETTLETFQREICRLFYQYDRLAIPACHSVGKTWTVGRLALAFLYCYKRSKVITTAPTHRQVVELLWGEIRSAKKNSEVYLEGKLINNKLTIDVDEKNEDQWYAMGFSPATGAKTDSKEQQGSSFQGFHAPYILIIFDEATGVSPDMYTMAEGLLTSGVVVKWLCIANPTSRISEFFKICQSDEWYVKKINCFDSPNMIANGFTSIEKVVEELNYLKTLSKLEKLERIKNYKKPNPNLLNAQWAMSKLLKWGLSHPLSLSKILGEFPESDDNSAIKWEHVQKAVNRGKKFEDEKGNLVYPPDRKYKKRYIGVDPARDGDDLSIITEIADYDYIGKDVEPKDDGNQCAGRVIRIVNDGNQTVDEIHIGVDSTGIGASVLDALNEAKREGVLGENVFIHEIHFGQPCQDPVEKEQERLRKIYENEKALIFKRLDEDLKDYLTLPDEEVYLEELPSVLMKWSRKGKLVIEMKVDYKARVKKSPDHTDSIAIANCLRYKVPNHGKFINTASKDSGKPFSKRKTNTFPEVKPTKLRVKEY